MRACWVVLFAVLLAATMCSAGQWEGRPYAGGGLLYSVERFNGDVTDDTGDADFDNSVGLFLKGGYFLMEDPVILAVEGLARYHNKYEASESIHDDEGFGFGGIDAEGSIEVKGYDLTVNGKVLVPVTEQILPYGVVGLGVARFTADIDASVEGAGIEAEVISDSETENGPIARFGAGCDWFLSDNLGIEGEISYNKCFSDLDGVNFVDFTIGAIYAF